MPIENPDSSSRSPDGEENEEAAWNPFWGPRELVLAREAQEADQRRQKASELETRQAIAHTAQLKSGMVPIGTSSDQFIPFPTAKDIIDQAHKIQKKLIIYRENWKKGEAKDIERVSLQKELMILIVSVDHFRKCSRVYLKSLDIIIELLSNMERALSPRGSGVILEGTLDVYNQQIVEMMTVLEKEKSISIITKLFGFLGIALLIAFAALPRFSSYHFEVWGILMLSFSLFYHKLYLWRNYITR